MQSFFRVCAAALTLVGAVAHAQSVTLRVATFNLRDVRSEDLKTGDNPRLRQIAEVIQRVRPNVILLNEIAAPMAGAPGVKDGTPPDDNAKRFAQLYLAHPQRSGLQPLVMTAFATTVNTGVPSGMDLDNDGAITTTLPAPPAPDAEPTSAAPGLSAYGNDCWGFGAFPGQYGMALLVDSRLELQGDKARTFRLLPWDYMPGAFLPKNADGTQWFTEEEKKTVRLSSKSHWDVPVKMPGGATVHFLCSHPTPPVFDGPERRNALRNHDEIAFWADYVNDAPWIVDDGGVTGGLQRGQHFVILGDLNADPNRGESYKSPIVQSLGATRRVNLEFVPLAKRAMDGLGPSDTASFGLRVDYVLPGLTMTVQGGEVWREAPTGAEKFPSDHFPVFLDITVPPEPKAPGTP